MWTKYCRAFSFLSSKPSLSRDAMQQTSPQWKIHGGHQLSGAVTTNGSKNSALAIISASLLTFEPILLTNVPRISDVNDMVSMLRSIGFQATWIDDNSLSLQRPLILDVNSLDIQAAQRTRAVVLLVAGLAIDHADFTIPFPGGCNLGDRSLEPHIDALEQLGLEVSHQSNGLWVRRAGEGDSETTITLLESGDTVTENAILAAVALNRGIVRICNASCNYMVQDLCSFLQQTPGVRIEGLGSPQLTVSRCESDTPGPIAYPILEDPIEAFFFIAAAVVTRSCLRVLRVPITFVSLELRLLQKMGLKVLAGPRYASASGVAMLCDLEILADLQPLNAMELKIHPNIYPFGVNVDNLPAFGPIAAVSEGQTLLHDWMYEQRAPYFALLRDFGVRVELPDKHRAYFHGPAELRASNCRLPPALRPASVVLLAALAAPGISYLSDVNVVSRGYEDLVGRLRSIQARVDVLDVKTDQQMPEGVIRSVM
jgi:UDP-N-acetylglucosamine 1-carboxyvinyltransferase